VATFKSYPNGTTMGRGNNAPTGGPRGKVDGWSRASVRRHLQWLYGVDISQLDGQGYGVTLTLRDTPQTHTEWAALVARLHRAFREAGLSRWHWVVEWQRRGTPHLHLAVYAPDSWESPISDTAGAWTIDTWLRLAAPYGAGSIAQTSVPITGAQGWLKYLSKHASRGVAHYQRQGKPAGWQSTGRLWGHGGAWPTVPPVHGVVDDPTFRRMRRMVRAYVIAESRAALLAARPGTKAHTDARRRLTWARRMLRCNDPGLSAVRGFSGWVPGPVVVSMALAAGWSGEVK
jgi:hypothetical protein